MAPNYGTCCICLEAIEVPGALKCGHVLDYKCLEAAMEQSPTCPVCSQNHSAIVIKLYPTFLDNTPPPPSFSEQASSKSKTVDSRLGGAPVSGLEEDIKVLREQYAMHDRDFVRMNELRIAAERLAEDTKHNERRVRTKLTARLAAKAAQLSDIESELELANTRRHKYQMKYRALRDELADALEIQAEQQREIRSLRSKQHTRPSSRPPAPDSDSDDSYSSSENESLLSSAPSCDSDSSGCAAQSYSVRPLRANKRSDKPKQQASPRRDAPRPRTSLLDQSRSMGDGVVNRAAGRTVSKKPGEPSSNQRTRSSKAAHLEPPKKRARH